MELGITKGQGITCSKFIIIIMFNLTDFCITERLGLDF